MGILATAAWALVWGWIGFDLSKAKNRSTTEGVILGVVLGPIGVIVEALLPNK